MEPAQVYVCMEEPNLEVLFMSEQVPKGKVPFCTAHQQKMVLVDEEMVTEEEKVKILKMDSRWEIVDADK